MKKAVETDADVVKKTGELGLAQMKKIDAEAEQAAAKAQKAADKAEKQAERLLNIVGRFSLKLLRDQWNAAVDYATSYYDKLNEIRVVTGKSEEEANKLGTTYRQMAEEMSVTSTELASAAVTFFRQGLNDQEVKSRLEWVTKYAKVANISFENAAELVTATSNAMSEDIQGDIQRVVDVFLYLGDNAATTGEEIGKAMQKASASATEFGLSFEWLGAYIATVSEQTRQAPESIGNAFNTMLARMHQIKATGFNSEDETRINDVAKALATINVELLDSDGEWRDMSEIYKDISEQWGTLDAKQRAYLATTMAGVRQQNVFYALMNDLSKGIEGGSRAWKLYTGAMEAAGTATEKYSTWQESLAASQANLTNSLENLYADLQPGIIKGFYDVLAWLTDGLNGTKVALAALIAVVVAFKFAVKDAGSVMAATSAAFAAHPIFATATLLVGILGVTGALDGLFRLFSDTSDKYAEAVEKMTEAEKKVTDLETAKNGLAAMLAKVQSGATLTAAELNKYKTELDTVASVSPTAEAAVRNLNGELGSQADILDTLIEKINAEIEAQLKLQQIQAEQSLMNFKNNSDFDDAIYYDRE